MAKAKKAADKNAAAEKTPINVDMPTTLEAAGLTVDDAREAGIEVSDDGTIISGHHRAYMLGKMKAGTIGIPQTTMLLTDSLKFGQDHPGLSVNMRATDRHARIDEMVQSIVTDGILQPLLVWRDVEGDGGDYVVVGSRRLTAVRKIRETHPTSFETLPALLIVGGTAADAAAKSLAAETTHLPLNQVDQFEAFTKVVAELPPGADPIKAVTSRFGVSPIIAERRLALGAMAPEIRQALREGAIDLGRAKEYTLLTDQERQAKIFKKLGKNSTEWQIRNAILGGAAAHDVPKLLNFVGAEAYQAAGGEVMRDLFNENSNAVSDADLLRRLAVEKLDAKVAALLSADDGNIPWAWASRADELPMEWKYTWQRLKITKGAANYHEREKSGAVVDIGGDGSWLLTFGVVKPGEKKAPSAKAEKKRGSAAKPEERGLSQNMVHQLQIRASEGLAAAIVLQPDVCLAAIVASYLAGYGPLKVTVNGLGAGGARKPSPFVPTLKALMNKTSAMKGIATVAGMAVDFRQGDPAPFADEDAAALAKLINPKAFNKAMRAAFAPFAEEYFGGIPLPMMRAAILEAGIISKNTYEIEGHKWGRSQCVGYSMADNGDGPQILATGWLPPELRGPGYDGPKMKAATKSKAKPTKKKNR